MRTVLVVDDETDLIELVRYGLEKEKYKVVAASDGYEALAAIRKEPPDAVVLDIMMPDLDGLSVLKRLRADPKTERLPVIVLTAKAEETDRIVGLELGADDYVVKPFSPRELVARVKALLRRTEQRSEVPALVLAAGPVRMDATRREVMVEGEKVPLTTTEFDLLQKLAANPGRVYTRGELMEHARGSDTVATERAIDAHIAAIRRKLGEEAGEWVETVRGYGYRFRDAS